MTVSAANKPPSGWCARSITAVMRRTETADQVTRPVKRMKEYATRA